MKDNSIVDEKSKWFQRGHASKAEYIGWLQFNNLVDESFSYDDTYYDPYTGKTIRIGSEETENLHDEADEFLEKTEK